MAVYFVQGKLGGGKSMACVDKIRTYMEQGRRVATNLDIFPEAMLSKKSRATVYRLPDKPRIEDLEQMGLGYDGPEDDYREDAFGALVLDELGSWLNARSWNDKERAKVIEWFTHARKYRWDIFFIVQDINIVDKQLRETLCEHLVICRRLDRLSVPFISPLFKLLTGKRLPFPRVHVATVYYGDNAQSLKVERWVYRGTDLIKAYRTRQVFKLDQLITDSGPVDMRAPYTVLSAWHLRGRYHVARPFAYFVGLGLLVLLSPLLALYAATAGCKPGVAAVRLGLLRRKSPVRVRCGTPRPAFLSPPPDLTPQA